jgi:hypothetical protein
MNSENWKDINGYEGLYMVSDKGNIKSINYNGKKGEKRTLRNHFTGKYFQITLYKNGRKKRFSIHRLVAANFIPNKENYNQVLHKDDDGLNNCVENLEWGNQSKNIKDAYSRGRVKLATPKKRIHQYDSKGVLVAKYESTREAESKTGISHKNLGQVALGKRKTAGGFAWRFEN